jgi:hypothetical protein
MQAGVAVVQPSFQHSREACKHAAAGRNLDPPALCTKADLYSTLTQQLQLQEARHGSQVQMYVMLLPCDHCRCAPEAATHGASRDPVWQGQVQAVAGGYLSRWRCCSSSASRCCRDISLKPGPVGAFDACAPISNGVEWNGQQHWLVCSSTPCPNQ